MVDLDILGMICFFFPSKAKVTFLPTMKQRVTPLLGALSLFPVAGGPHVVLYLSLRYAQRLHLYVQSYLPSHSYSQARDQNIQKNTSTHMDLACASVWVFT